MIIEVRTHRRRRHVCDGCGTPVPEGHDLNDWVDVHRWHCLMGERLIRTEAPTITSNLIRRSPPFWRT